MKFQKGNKYGNRFSATNQPQKKRSNPINAVVKEFTKENEIPKVDDVRRMYLSIMTMPKKKIEELFNNEDQPVLVRVVARAILSKNGFDYIEKMLDRTFGKPTQVTENYNENRGIGEGPKIIFEMGKSDE
jgi:ribosome assembly protein YihI (activator of Der GTPase)